MSPAMVAQTVAPAARGPALQATFSSSPSRIPVLERRLHQSSVSALASPVACLGLMGVAVAERRWGQRRNQPALPRLVRHASGEAEAEGTSPEEEILARLRSVRDEGLGTDIVTCGFVKNVQVNKASGRVIFDLEVGTYANQARVEVLKVAWVKEVGIRPVGGGAPPSKPDKPAPPPTPASLEKVQNILAVSSCKGGVGKSTVAVNLAFALQKTGAKVGIFDCDVYGPSLPVMVRFEETPQMQMYQDEQKQKHIVPVTHEESGIKLVSFGYAGKGAVMRGPVVTSLIVQLIQQTDWGELDYLVLDLPPGTGDIHLTLAQVCKIRAAVIVTTPQKLSVVDVENGINMFNRLDIPSVAVVQNMSYFSLPNGDRQYVFGKTDAGRQIASTFGINEVFEIPVDASISEAGDSGVPFVQSSSGPAAAEMSRLAATVIEEVTKLRNKPLVPVP